MKKFVTLVFSILLAVILMLLLSGIPAFSQQLPDVPKPHLDKIEWSMLAADVAVRSMDTATTRLALTDSCHCYRETSNAQWIVESTPRLAVYGVAVPVFYWYITRELTIHHHTKLAHFTAGFDAVYDGVDVVNNFNEMK